MTTAIVLFSRLPKTEAVFKTFTGKAFKDEALWSALYQRTLSIARSTHLPLVSFTELEQQGASFGERICHAASTVFAQGYNNIILIGADCTGLCKAHLTTAHRQLVAGNKLVAGPDKRGGIFLLGLNKAAFDPAIFQGFAWQRRTLFAQLKAYAVSLPHYLFKTPIQDINTITDVVTESRAFGISISLRKLFLTCFYQAKQFYHRDTFIQPLLHFGHLSLRAPPLLRFYQP